jgi:hypothetical protein
MLLRQETSEHANRLVVAAMRDLVRQSAREADEDAAGWAQLGFELVRTGLSVFWQGDIRYTGPTSQIGVQMPNKPDLDYQWIRKSRTIIQYRTTTAVGIEAVNVQFRCDISYSGPEVLASFGFAAGGQRARLGSEAEVSVREPLPLKTVPTTAEWQAIGIRRYPVIEIPIEFRVDEPWPNDNHEETFSLVLSGMHGFGAPGVAAIIRRSVRKT